MSDSLKIGLAQINPTVGDIAGNAKLIFEWYEQAAAQKADLLVLPELAVTGYPPEDLILMPAFRMQAMEAVLDLAEQAQVKYPGGPAMLVGCVWEADETVFNAALLIDGGEILHVQPKSMLPNYGVFDEKRLFSSGDGPEVAQWRGMSLGILICEDMWYPALAAECKEQGAELVIVINASPFEAGKLKQRRGFGAESALAAGVPVVYVNMCGGQDDIVFDGGSFVLGADGNVAKQMPEFVQAMDYVALQKKDGKWLVAPSQALQPMGIEESVWSAMKLGLHDYVHKNRFAGVMLGLSGGIDSAVTAALAVDALGKDNVKGVLLSSPFTSKESVNDAMETAQMLGIETMSVPITPGMEMFTGLLDPIFSQPGWMENPLVGGNIQARLRGIIMMAISNRFGWMLLSTGNKSEISVGYSTLYGDSCGGFNVLKDVYKMQVYALANWRNGQGAAVPQGSITRAPSAELAPGQKDEDQLPPYELLDQVLALHIEGQQDNDEIIAQGFDVEMVKQVTRMVRLSEYKRRQSCPGVKVSPMLFGKDRRFPLTNKF